MDETAPLTNLGWFVLYLFERQAGVGSNDTSTGVGILCLILSNLKRIFLSPSQEIPLFFVPIFLPFHFKKSRHFMIICAIPHRLGIFTFVFESTPRDRVLFFCSPFQEIPFIFLPTFS